MKVNLQCWWFGRLTVNLEVSNVTASTTINELLIRYFNEVIKPVSPAMALNTALSKMELCGNNNFIYDKNGTLGGYNILDGHCFTVLAGFNY